MPLSTELGRVKPLSVRQDVDGSYLYTFPKNFVGQIEFASLPKAANGSNLTVRDSLRMGRCCVLHRLTCR